MIVWGFIMLLAGALTCIGLLLGNLDLFSRIGTLGFGGYIEAFFDKQNLTANKVIFLVAVAVVIIGLVLYFVGRVKHKGDDKNPIVPAKVSKFFRDTRGEFKKIVWPGLPSVVRNTIATLIMCAIVGAIIIVIDLGLDVLVNLLLDL